MDQSDLFYIGHLCLSWMFKYGINGIYIYGFSRKFNEIPYSITISVLLCYTLSIYKIDWFSGFELMYLATTYTIFHWLWYGHRSIAEV